MSDSSPCIVTSAGDSAPGGMSARAPQGEGLLVSIHDVTPALEDAVRRLWALCRAQGVTPALLVVPDWHGAWPLESHPAFVAWVRECADAGAEIILHGERHDEVGLPRTWRDDLRALGRTAREGEFLTLDHDAARARIDRGIGRLRALGLDPIGFIPPAWLARESTHDVVRMAGLRVSEDAGTIRVHSSGVRLPAPALRWSGRSTMRAVGSRAMAWLRWCTQRHASYVRMALHPQDLAHAITAQSVEREVTRWTRARRVVPYAAL